MNSLLMKQIADLASRYPGIKIRRYSGSSKGCSIEMHIDNMLSMARVIVSASVSNLKCEAFAYSRPENADYSDSSLIIYRLSTPDEPHPKDRHSSMEMFGIDMAHDLRDFGILDNDTAADIIDEITDRLEE